MKPFRQMVQERLSEEDDVLLLTENAGPRPQGLGAWNPRGLGTLAWKEIARFLKIPFQTIVSPLVMTFLFYAVFSLALGQGNRSVGGVPFLQFLIPGLIVMSMAQAAFMNNAASLILSKLQGNIVDLLMAPLSPFELVSGYAVAGLARGLIVGGLSVGVMAFVMPMRIVHPEHVFYFAVMGSLMLSLGGLVTGLWGQDFDQFGAVQNFIVLPATFLSGSFFSVSSLPQGWSFLCTLNPFFYMIDGFRYGFTGYADGDLWSGAALLLFVDLALFNVAYWIVASGARLKT